VGWVPREAGAPQRARLANRWSQIVAVTIMLHRAAARSPPPAPGHQLHSQQLVELVNGAGRRAATLRAEMLGEDEDWRHQHVPGGRLSLGPRQSAGPLDDGCYPVRLTIARVDAREREVTECLRQIITDARAGGRVPAPKTSHSSCGAQAEADVLCLLRAASHRASAPRDATAYQGERTQDPTHLPHTFLLWLVTSSL
jgi:hypothetical protein